MKNTHPQYEKDLEKLAKLLRRRKLTAREIARELNCCLPTVYQRLRALEQRGARLKVKAAPSKRTGPRAQQFGIQA